MPATSEASSALTRRQFLRQSLLIAGGALLPPAPVLAAAAIGEAPNLAGSLGIELPGDLFPAHQTGRANPISTENALPGVSDWRPRQYQFDISGFASATSAAAGQRLEFFVQASSPTFDLRVYRLGYYGGAGARLMAEIRDLPGTLQPDLLRDDVTGLASCGNWTPSHALTVPADWVSGVYLTKLTRPDTGGEGFIVFVVRDDARNAEVLVQHPVTTYHAYNNFGGRSLYSFNSQECETVSEAARAVKVSLHRPYNAPLEDPSQFLRVEYPLLYWLEAHGYDLNYCTNLDVHGYGRPGAHNRLVNHHAFFSVGHDEYWSQGMRDAVTAARDAGVHLAFFGANTCFWHVRFEPDPWTGQPDRVMVCYKSTESGKPDPSGHATGTWRDSAGAHEPENALLGAQYIGDNDSAYFPLRVSAEHSRDRVYRHTGLQNLAPGTHADIGRHLLGWEWDAVTDNGRSPESLTVLAASPVYGALLTDDGNEALRIVAGAHANVTRYRASSGALVFSTGTLQWSWGLALQEPDRRIQQITYNALADMGIQPATPAETLVLNEAAGDEVRPTSATAPTPLPAPHSGERESGTVVPAGSAATNIAPSPAQAKLAPVPVFLSVNVFPEDTHLTVTWSADRPVHAQVWLGAHPDRINQIQTVPSTKISGGQFHLKDLHPGTHYWLRLAGWECADCLTFSAPQPFSTRWPTSMQGARELVQHGAEPATCAARPAARWAFDNTFGVTALVSVGAAIVGLSGWRWAVRAQVAAQLAAQKAARNARQRAMAAITAADRLAWVDSVKGLALVWIVINHFAERLFGFPWVGNPSAAWPRFEERLSQLQWLTGYSMWDVWVNALRYVGWLGDNGVQLFLITSGFGLTWGLLARGQTGSLSWREFFASRTGRLYPLWWAAHLLFVVPAVVLGRGLNPADLAFYLSLAGVRVTPETLYYFAPAWWFVTLLLQLYLVYPWLWRALQRLGPRNFLFIIGGAALLIRGAGLFFFTDYLDAWSRGAIFITRLPEFVFGMALAVWWQRNADRVERRLASPASLALAVLGWGVALPLALTLAGMTIAPFILGLSAFVISFQMLRLFRHPGLLRWLGEHSYPLYLVHHPLIILLVGFEAALSIGTGMRSGVALVLTVIVGIGLERATVWVTRWLRQHARRIVRVSAVTFVLLSVLLSGAEAAVRRWHPQEVLGWGERPALQSHPEFGWTLRPSQVTYLRWEGYDYIVTANALGFPGPDYAEAKPPGALRVFTLGDAFTSAEGVDTAQAWPRLLEQQLPGRTVQVLNFAITGYGPEQNAAVLAEFGPRYRPDVIVLEMYVNDYEDVLLSNEEFRAQIGFGQPDPEAWLAFVRFSHLRQFASRHVLEPLRAVLRAEPDAYGYYLAGLPYLEQGRTDLYETGRARVRTHLRAIHSIATQMGARLIIMLVPTPAQVCPPHELAYFPRQVTYPDDGQFDLELPQRVTAELADELGVKFFDLRPVLSAASDCPYFSHNLHWTAAGHRQVTDYLHQVLVAEGLAGSPQP